MTPVYMPISPGSKETIILDQHSSVQRTRNGLPQIFRINLIRYESLLLVSIGGIKIAFFEYVVAYRCVVKCRIHPEVQNNE